MRRFGEFQKSLGIAKNILAARLRKLAASGILEMVPAADGSAFHEYALTDKGRGLFIVIAALGQWGGGMLFRPGESPAVIADRRTHTPIRPLELRSKDGKILGPEDIEFVLNPTTRSKASRSKAKARSRNRSAS
jgi:DNA-binding HxlR family transcriptional regulator